VLDDALRLRLTNTGTAEWPEGAGLVAGWESTDAPYLAHAPEDLAPLDIEIPALAPGESVLVAVELPRPPGNGRAVAWISLMDGSATLADRGSPALQLATRGLP
jgi:hypothetical protein